MERIVKLETSINLKTFMQSQSSQLHIIVIPFFLAPITILYCLDFYNLEAKYHSSVVGKEN